MTKSEVIKVKDFNFIFGQLRNEGWCPSPVKWLPCVGSIPMLTTESRNNGRPPLPYGSQSVKLVKWGK